MSNSSNTELPGASPRESQHDFESTIDSEMKESQREILNVSGSYTSSSEATEQAYNTARQIVHGFKPAPQLIWRISSFVLGRPNNVNKLSEGSLFGLNRLIVAIGSDSTLGQGKGSSTARALVANVSSDVIAAACVIHALARRLQTNALKAVWGPILEDALLRARVGYHVGSVSDSFGPGRGMLAGFAGRIGLAVLLASGEAEKASMATASLASGEDIDKVTLELYGAAPTHVAGMLLAALGCGRDAALGVAGFGMSKVQQELLHEDAQKWLASFRIIEALRSRRLEELPPGVWQALQATRVPENVELEALVDSMVVEGHGWNWLT